MTIIILFLLVLPVWLLFTISVTGSMASSPTGIGILVLFTLIFSNVLSFFTKAKRHEILAASAA